MRGVEQLSARQHLLVARGGLAVRPHPRGRPGRDEALRDDGAVVTGLHGVVQDPERVRVLELEQDVEHVGVQLDPLDGRQGLDDGASRELVPEPDHGATHFEHPGPLGLLERSQVAHEAPEQVELRRRTG